MGTPHVTFEQIIAYAAGMLSAQDAANVVAHLANNPQDVQTVSRYRLAQQAMATDDSVEPSPAAVARAKAVFKPQSKANRLGWLEAVDRFIATLVFDSRVQPLALRYSQAEDRINLTFEADEVELDLQAERIPHSEGAERWQMIGQLSSAEAMSFPAAASIALTKAGTKTIVAQASADGRGGFSFETVPGKYDLFVQTSRGVMIASNIDIA